jgi:hypothetical protein
VQSHRPGSARSPVCVCVCVCSVCVCVCSVMCA